MRRRDVAGAPSCRSNTVRLTAVCVPARLCLPTPEPGHRPVAGVRVERRRPHEPAGLRRRARHLPRIGALHPAPPCPVFETALPFHRPGPHGGGENARTGPRRWGSYRCGARQVWRSDIDSECLNGTADWMFPVFAEWIKGGGAA